MLYLELRFVPCKEVAFARMKKEGIFKDWHKKLEELIDLSVCVCEYVTIPATHL